MIARSFCAVLLLAAAMAYPDESSDTLAQPEYLDADDPVNVDVEGSLDYGLSKEKRATFNGDMRGGYFNVDIDGRDGSSEHTDEYALRLRYGVNFGFTDYARIKARLAARCSDSSCDPGFDGGYSPAYGANTANGDIVLDELYLDFFQRGRFDLALGRMQTRSVTRGGVFVTSLSRMTSPNLAINWTDGAALRYQADNGWDSQLILQYNDSDGPATLARRPLDFEDDDSRYSAFYSLESRQPWGMITQRAVDVTYLPSTLVQDDSGTGSREDYWNLVGRLAAQWPVAPTGPSLIVSGELGYAPETPSKQSSSTGANGDTDGLAWHLEASWMNFRPGHSIGVNYGYTDPGWLISPSYRSNEETAILRYHWRPIPRLQVEAQARWRQDNEKLLNAAQKRETFDWRVRLTWVLETRESRRFRR